MKNIKKSTIACILMIVLLLSIILLSNTISAQANALTSEELYISQQHDKKLISEIHTPNLEEDFSEDEVIVILKGEYSNFNLKTSTNISKTVLAQLCKFENIERNEIEDLFPLQNQEAPEITYRKMLSLGLKTTGKEKVIEAIEFLQNLDMVLVAQPKYNYSVSDDWVPSDADYFEQWGLKGTHGINVEKAWDISRGSNVKVGIFESGIDFTHEDLNGRIGGGSFTPASGTDLSHGTHVGGIISAVANDKGIAGISEATLFLLDKSNFVLSLQYAISHGIKIINASFYYMRGVGDEVPALPDAAHSQAIVNYGNFGGLLICASGNLGDNTDYSPQYPACYGDIRKYPNINNVISVGAIDSFGDRWSLPKGDASNFGINSVHIYAPGEHILSTYPTSLCTNGSCIKSTHYANGYHYMSGTSMAAPHVAGVAALMLAKNPNLTVAELKEAILSSADDITISIPNNGSQNVKKLNAYEAVKSICYEITFDKQGGQGGDDNVYITYGEDMPAATAPTRAGYRFSGYYSQDGAMYYDSNMNSVRVWDKTEDETLYAQWDKLYKITFKIEGDTKDEYTFIKEVCDGDKWPTITMPTRQGYYVDKYEYEEYNRRYYDRYGQPTYDTFNFTQDITLTGKWTPEYYSVVVSRIHWDMDRAERVEVLNVRFDQTYTLTADATMTARRESDQKDLKRPFTWWQMVLGGEGNLNFDTNPWITYSKDLTFTFSLNDIVEEYYHNFTDVGLIEFRAIYFENPINDNSCVAEGTLITLANGEQVPVEQLTGSETLLVWNLFTGTFDTAPILCIDSESLGIYEVINLYFSDGTTVKVISEHGFWDLTLNKYVYLRKDASQYIGHWFNKQTTDENNQLSWTEVQLTDVVITEEYTTAWSPVTYSHLCYYVNGMLSMPGGIEGLFNIFEVDSQTLKYNEASYLQDIETYGLYTYEEFSELLPVSEELFEAVNGKYLKVAIGKGLIDLDTIESYINQYSALFD